MRFRWIALGVVGIAILAVVALAYRSEEGFFQDLEPCVEVSLAYYEANQADWDVRQRESALISDLPPEVANPLISAGYYARRAITDQHLEQCVQDPVLAIEDLCVVTPDAGHNERSWHNEWCP